MKQIMMAILALSTCVYGAHAVTTCVKNNVFIGVLKKNVNGTSSEHTDSTKVWRVVFDYITLTGNAACNEISGTYATPTTNLVTSASDEGTYCWCRMWPVSSYNKTTGMTSYWMYLTNYSNATTCASTCTGACKNAVSSDTTFRSAMFESVW